MVVDRHCYHMAHPQYSAEWWYLTGHGILQGLGQVNFHIAFFRKFSKTLNRHFWFAHHGYDDGKNFWLHRKYNLNKSYATLGGCVIDDWRLSLYRDPICFRTKDGNLMLGTPQKNAVWHDAQCYSITDMDLRGTLMNRDFRGRGWFDHSFFDASINELLALRYTWIALQLDAGFEIMVQLSSRKPHFLGTLVYPSGKYYRLDHDDCYLVETETGWKLILKKHDLRLMLHKRVENKVQGNPEPGYIEGILDCTGGSGYFEIAEGNTKSILRG